MQLTGKQIEDRCIITNISQEGVQQQGIDVRLKKVSALDGVGVVPAEGKTIKPASKDFDGTAMWESDGRSERVQLNPGYYEIEFMEGCSIPNNAVLNFKTRSSLVRCGAIVRSGQFDAGFHTDNMGAFLHVIRPIVLERGARVAQAVITESYPVDDENLYNGQWQNDKQRL